jgi:hypothetical protein
MLTHAVADPLPALSQEELADLLDEITETVNDLYRLYRSRQGERDTLPEEAAAKLPLPERLASLGRWCCDASGQQLYSLPLVNPYQE